MGWSPKRIPETLLREAATGLQDRFLFGSDYPFITPQRWLKDFEPLTYFTPEVREKLMWGNAQKLLTHTCIGYLVHPFEKETLWAVITNLFLSVSWNSAIEKAEESFSITRENTGVGTANHQERHPKAP